MSKIFPFNFKAFITEKNCDEFELANWLKKNGFNISLNKTVLFGKKKYQKLINCINSGIKNNLQGPIEKQLKEIHVNKKKLQEKISRLNVIIKNYFSKIEKAENTDRRKTYNERLKQVEDDMLKIQNQYRKAKAESSLKFNSHYQDSVKEKKHLLQLLSQPIEKLAEKEIGEIREQINLQLTEINSVRLQLEPLIAKETELKEKLKEEKQKKDEEAKSKQETGKIKASSNPRQNELRLQNNIESYSTKITVDWKNIIFHNGYIVVKLQNHFSQPFTLKESRKSLNAIKALYKFRNAPKLIIELIGNRINVIQNLEALYFYLTFLSFADTFDKTIVTNFHFPISKFNGYTKSFYHTHLPNLFLPKYFNFLCEYSVEDLPIIPIPETVINTTGNAQIHDSFLFPITKDETITWIWESIEESKASYVFITSNSDYEKDLQMTFDYLTGDIQNKRQNLIYNSELAKKLGLIRRILHTEEYHWKSEMKSIIKYKLNI